MIVLGVDPGLAITGWGVVKESNKKLITLGYGSIKTEKGLSYPQRLKIIYNELTQVIMQYNPRIVAVEELFFNKNVKTALRVAEARGVAILAAMNAGRIIAEYTPLQVKQALVGYGRASKFQIQKMVQVVLRLEKVPSPDDTADALAVAVCHINSDRIGNILSSRNVL